MQRIGLLLITTLLMAGTCFGQEDSVRVNGSLYVGVFYPYEGKFVSKQVDVSYDVNPVIGAEMIAWRGQYGFGINLSSYSWHPDNSRAMPLSDRVDLSSGGEWEDRGSSYTTASQYIYFDDIKVTIRRVSPRIYYKAFTTGAGSFLTLGSGLSMTFYHEMLDGSSWYDGNGRYYNYDSDYRKTALGLDLIAEYFFALDKKVGWRFGMEYSVAQVKSRDVGGVTVRLGLLFL